MKLKKISSWKNFESVESKISKNDKEHEKNFSGLQNWHITDFTRMPHHQYPPFLYHLFFLKYLFLIHNFADYSFLYRLLLLKSMSLLSELFCEVAILSLPCHFHAIQDHTNTTHHLIAPKHQYDHYNWAACIHGLYEASRTVCSTPFVENFS